MAQAKPTIQIPAVCDDCGRVFASGWTLSLGAYSEFKRCSAGPCPYCGHEQGTIPDGKYEYRSETEKLVTGWSRQRQMQLVKAIEAAQETNDPKAAIAQVVESDPDLAAIATRLLIPKDAAQFWAFVAVVISILQLVTSGPGSTTVIQQQIKVIKKIKKPQSSQKATKKKKQARGKRQKPQQQKKGSKQRRK